MYPSNFKNLFINQICVQEVSFMINVLNDVQLLAQHAPLDEPFDFFSMFVVNQMNLKDKQMDKAHKLYTDNS
jgi:hypothetical protein